MGVFKSISNFFKGGETKIIKHELDQDSVKVHNAMRGMANQIAELQGTVSKQRTEIFELKGLKEQKLEEKNIKQYLHEDKKQLDKKSVQKFFSLKAFFIKYFNDKNFRNKLRITTFDRSENLASFGDFGFVGNSFVILDKQNRKILGTRELKDLFQSIGALKNDISSFKIPINLDKDGGYIENLMVWEAPEIIRGEDGFKYTKAKKGKLYDLLKEKDAMIQQGYIDLEEAEETIVKQQDRLDELELSSKANQKSGEIARAERVKTAETVSKIEEIWKDTETELTKMRQIHVLQEDEIKALEKEFNKLKKKAEEEGIALKFDEVVDKLDKVKDLFKQKTLVLPQNPTNKPSSE